MKTIRILDEEKFVYIFETCRYYGIQHEVVDEPDNLPPVSEPSPGQIKRGRINHAGGSDELQQTHSAVN